MGLTIQFRGLRDSALFANEELGVQYVTCYLQRRSVDVASLGLMLIIELINSEGSSHTWACSIRGRIRGLLVTDRAVKPTKATIVVWLAGATVARQKATLDHELTHLIQQLTGRYVSDQRFLFRGGSLLRYLLEWQEIEARFAGWGSRIRSWVGRRGLGD